MGQEAPSTDSALPCIVRPLPDLYSVSQTQDQALEPPYGPQDVSFPEVSNEISDDQHDAVFRDSLQKMCDEKPYQERPREEGRNLSLPPARYNRAKSKKVKRHVDKRQQKTVP